MTETKTIQWIWVERGPHITMDSVLASHPEAQGSIPVVPNNFSEFLMLLRLIDGAAA